MNPNHCQIKKHNMPIFISFGEVGGGGGLVDEKPIDASGKTATTTSYSGDIVNHYTYQGRKLGKKVYNSQHTLTVDEEYYDELMLSFGVPSRISHGDGYVTLNKIGQAEAFYFYLKDHLGNVRSVILPDANNNPVVTQANDYFPFGMSFESSLPNPGIRANYNKLKYNGKEEQEMPGKWLDYGARFYDGQIGRFHSVDPLAEKYPWATPYSYCFNNPINSIDPDGREPITLSILAARAAIGAAIGAGIDITVQMTANMTLGNQGFWDAAGSIDWTSVGASAVTGAVGVPGANVISKTAKVATIATAVAFDAAVDISVAEGNQNIFNGEKSLSTATIDAAGSLFAGKASDDIVKGAKNSISKDISSGTYSTLNKAEKSTLRQTQAVVNSQGFEAGTNTVVKLGAEAGKQGAKSVVGTGSVPNSVVLPQVQNYTQPMDNTRVVRPVYPLR
jgi:RHS repeat-associated protein